MQSAHWIALLKKLPPEVHNQLTVVTMGGTEAVVQSLLMMEGECLIFKGRLAASQEMGRLFYVPYDQIDYIGFTRSVAEEEFRSWYGDSNNPNLGSCGETMADVPPHRTPLGTPVPSRAALLERIRARTSSHSG